MTSAGMIAGITPGVLWKDYNMKDLNCHWSKIPTHTFSRFSETAKITFAEQLFTEIVINNNPVILYGDDGTGGDYSTHFVVVYGFAGVVNVDIDGEYTLSNYDLKQFKVHDPSTYPGYGNHLDAASFNERFPIQNLRIPSLK